MANSFNKQETVAFDEAMEGFNDALVASKAFEKYTLPDELAERSGNTIWRPQPYIAQSFVGLDQTSNFARNYTQLSVPTTLGYSHAVPMTFTATELRDLLQEQRLGRAAMQRLASDINVDCSNLAALTGTIVVKRTTAATGFDDVAAMDTAFNRLGIAYEDRKGMLSSGDYNSMASNLAQRQTLSGKAQTAYERAMIGNVAGFDLWKLDYAYRLAAAGATGVQVTNAGSFYTPQSTTAVNSGLVQANVDNRYQNLQVTVGAGTIKVGDAFTIAGVNEVHHITKQDTGSAKTFRVTGIISGGGGTGVIQISPPIISGGGGADAELQYRNVTSTPLAGAAITFLNTSAAAVNPFWQGDAFEIMPGRYKPAENSGLAIMSATTDNGIQVVMTRQGAINDLSTKYRWDVFYGLVNKQPEMTGIELFSQT